MSESSQVELEKTASAYEELLVPALFEEWANHMVDAADVQPGDKVLDVACGTGVLTCAIAQRVGAGGSVTGLDLNPGMLAVAERKAPAVDWRKGSAESLPFGDEIFDIVASQFGLMLFGSPESALQEMNRVLKQGGRLLVAVFDALNNNPAYAAMADVYERVVGPAVGDALRFPFSMGDSDALTSLFRRSGIHEPVVSTHTGVAQFQNPRHMVLSDVKGWFPFAQIHLDAQTIDRVVQKATKDLAPYTTSDGEVLFDVSVRIVSASKT